jgi:hypothetical protein
MSMPGLDAVGRPVVGQISNPGATAIVPVISDVYQETPQLRGTRDARYRVALAASGQFRDVFFDIPFQPSWFEALSEPVRKKPRSPAALSPFGFFQPAPSPFVATGWYANLSIPVRVRPRLREGLQQFLAYQDNPTTVTPFAWYANLSDPVRIKPGLRTSLQQFFTGDTSVIPIERLIAWFDWLSDPVRIKPGLRASLQQFLAAPPRVLPTPTSFGILDALETKDTFLAGAVIWNRATDAEIGVINTTPQPAEIGLYQTAPAAGTITVRISIIIG